MGIEPDKGAEKMVRIRFGGLSRAAGILFAAMAFIGQCTGRNWVQGADRSTPSTRTTSILEPFTTATTPTPCKGFDSESRSSIKTVQSRWIDSICYETMCGECYFQMGRLDEALQRYTNALELYRVSPTG